MEAHGNPLQEAPPAPLTASTSCASGLRPDGAPSRAWRETWSGAEPSKPLKWGSGQKSSATASSGRSEGATDFERNPKEGILICEMICNKLEELKLEITHNIVDFIIGTNYKNIPEGIIDLAKRAILDNLGVALAGASYLIGEILNSHLLEAGGKEESTVIGLALKTSRPNAALANGVLAHFLDYDDTHWPYHGHPSSTVLPPALAVAEYDRLSGKEVLAAFALGLETECRIGISLYPILDPKGFHITGVAGTFGSVAAAGKLLGLSSEELSCAFGIVGSLAAGLRANFGTMTKSLHVGKACYNGVMAAMLAKRGFTANKKIIEALLGFSHAFSGQQEYSRMIDGIGERWVIQDPGDHKSGLWQKYYPCGGSGGGTFETMIPMVKRYNIDPEDVASVETYVSRHSFDSSGRIPSTGLEGRFSIPFWVAVSIIDKEVTLDTFTDEKTREPEIKRLMEKVKLHINAEKAQLAHFKVKMKDGSIYENELGSSQMKKGGLENPLSYEDLENKYRSCAKLVLPEEKIDKSIDMLMELENITDISQLMALMNK